jgi:hypothetical protein
MQKSGGIEKRGGSRIIPLSNPVARPLRSSLAPILCGSQLLLSACGLSALDGLSGGGPGENADGVTQSDTSAIDAQADGPVGADGQVGDAGGGSTTDAKQSDGAQPEEASPGDASPEEASPGDASPADAGGCPAGTFGQTCQPCPACAHGTCNDGATGDGACSCTLGWGGPACDQTSTLATGLGLYWKFDETSGTVALDSSGNNVNGNYVTATGVFPTPAAGVVPPSMTSWDPASLSFTWRQAVQITAASPGFAFVRPANNMTISLWYRASASDLGANGSELVSIGDHLVIRIGKESNPATPFSLQFNKNYTGTSYVQCQNPFPVGAGAPSLVDGSWHHIAAISSSTAPGMAIYFDGTLVPCTKFNNSTFATSDISYGGLGQDFWVGRHGNNKTSYDFQGNLDELRIYNRVLSEVEIQALAQGSQE